MTIKIDLAIGLHQCHLNPTASNRLILSKGAEFVVGNYLQAQSLLIPVANLGGWCFNWSSKQICKKEKW